MQHFIDYEKHKLKKTIKKTFSLISDEISDYETYKENFDFLNHLPIVRDLRMRVKRLEEDNQRLQNLLFSQKIKQEPKSTNINKKHKSKKSLYNNDEIRTVVLPDTQIDILESIQENIYECVQDHVQECVQEHIQEHIQECVQDHIQECVQKHVQECVQKHVQDSTQENIIYELIENEEVSEDAVCLSTNSDENPALVEEDLDEEDTEESALEEEDEEEEEEAALEEEEEESALEEEEEEEAALEEEEEEAALEEEEEESLKEEEESLKEEEESLKEEEESLEEEEEEEESEVYEITIKNKKYYTTSEVDGIIYTSEQNGDVGDVIGYFKNSKAILLKK